MLTPDDAEVESENTLLFVEDRPVDTDARLLCAVLTPLDAEVDSDVTLLLVDDKPLESEPTPL